MEDILKLVSLEDLENELLRRKAQVQDHAVMSLPDEELKSNIEEKKLNEFQTLHDQMFPGASKHDDWYPKWQESRMEQVKDQLKNKGKKLSLGESMYPSLGGK